MTLAELAEQSGIPARTVRFYIARGLMPGPSVAGRGADYGREHLARLGEIRAMQSRGLTLVEIARRLGGGEEELPRPEGCWRYALAPDVTVEVRADLAPWRMRRIQAALRDFKSRLKAEEGEEDGER